MVMISVFKFAGTEASMGILKKIGRELGLVPKPRHKRKAMGEHRARAKRRRMPPRKKNGEFKSR